MINRKKKQLMVHAYKYNGWLYRVVESPSVLYENNHVLCLYFPINQVASWKNKESTEKNFYFKNIYHKLWFFFKNHWFNILVNYFDDHFSFYVNLASPYLIEEGAIKYIDFDLDFRVQNDNSWKLVDKSEYQENCQRWNYPKEIQRKIQETTNEIIYLIKSGWFSKLFNESQDFYMNKLIKIVFANETFIDEEINFQKKISEQKKHQYFPSHKFEEKTFLRKKNNLENKFNYKKNTYRHKSKNCVKK